MLRIDARKKQQARRQAGFVVTVELLLITVILIVGLVTGMTKLRDQTIAELSDTGAAIGSINQSYSVKGTSWASGLGDAAIALTSGFAFDDESDPANGNTDGVVGGDTQYVVYNRTPTPSTTTSGVGEDIPQYRP